MRLSGPASDDPPPAPACPAPAGPVLRLRDLCVSFGGARAVHGVSLDLQAGRTLCLVGASGAGKSTVGLAIARLVEFGGGAIEAGRIAFDDGRGTACDLARATPRAMQRLRGTGIGMVFQDPGGALNPVLPLGTQLTEGLRRHAGLGRRAACARALDLLGDVGLDQPGLRMKQYPHELSGGQRQRVLIAMALAGDPRLLIADEPTAALDASVAAGILALLERLRRARGLALLLITHDMGVVARMADRVAVLEAGRLVEEGAAQAVLARPRHAQTRALLEAVPRAAPGRAAAQAKAPDLLRIEGLCVDYATRRAGRVQAVRDLGLRLERGRILALVGESGSGKSSVARAVMRLIPAQAGRIMLEGRDIAALRGGALHEVRARMQMVFQDPAGSFDPRRRLGAQVAEPLQNYRAMPREARRAEVARLFGLVDLAPDLARRWPHEVSGGQLQRAAIARALALRPALIVADEITSALDTVVQAQILALLQRLQAEMGLACLFISHDLGVVAQIAQDVAVMQRGRIVEYGPCAQVLGAPQHAHTRALLAALPRAQGAGAAPGGAPATL